MEWTEFLTQAERERIAAIKRERSGLTAEYRRIYDRCRKRMEAQAKTGTGNTPRNR